MRVGLFFGSFNPVHIGHMALANYMLEYTNLQELWFVVSPQNPLKQKAGLLDQQNRLSLVSLAIEEHPRMRVSNIEFSLPQPSYTINTLVRLQEKHPEHEFSLIMGADNLQSLHKWKNYEEILKNYHVYVYPRPGATTVEFEKHPHVHLTDAPLMDISATFIRNALLEKKDIRFYLPLRVWEEIQSANYYKK